MTVTLSLFAGAGAQFLDNNGNILSGGLIYTYTAGTTTPLVTFTSNLGDVAQPNPIVLDSAGRIPGGELWLTTGFGYKFVVKDANNVLIGTYDNIPSSAQPPITNDASSISYEEGYTVTAGSFVIGNTYLITSLGNTNFQLIGASANQVGTTFIATGVGYGTGTAKLSRTVQSRLQDTVSVKDFGAVGDGTTDDTAAIQAALNANLAVYFPPATYLVSALTLQGFQKISGYGATLQASTPTGKILTCPTGTNGIQTTNYTEISGLSINGYSSSISSGSAGIYTTGNNTFTIKDVKVKNFDLGFYLGATQFGSFYSIKAYNCNVGVYIKSDTTAGGGNSNSFYDLITLSCTLGVLINGQLPFVTSANYFRNYTGNSNSSALGIFNSSCTIDGGAPENNSGTSSSYDGLSITGGIYYLNNSNVIFSNVSDADAVSATSVIYAENNSVSNLNNTGGYGSTGGKFAICDSTSTINTFGSTGLNGTLPNIFSNISTSTASNGSNLFQCLDNSYLSISLPNECTSPLTSTLNNSNGIVSSGTAWDTTYGLVGSVVFATSVASQDSNRIFLGSITNNAAFSVIGISLYSDTNTSIYLGFYGYDYKQSVNLIAGKWCRLYYVTENASILANAGYVLYPESTDGPTVKIAKVMIYSSSTYDAGAVQAVNSVLGGAYNSQTPANHYGRYFNAAPSTGTWSVGQIVYNTVPASAGYIGWVCTVAGTPGTWNTFGLIS